MSYTDELEDLVKKIDDFAGTSLTDSETNTKQRIIEPLLDILGWDTRGNEVVLEYPIMIGSSTKQADYALILEDKTQVLVEAKPFSADLTTDHSRQVISYGKVEDVRWTALTNGKILKVFDTEKGRNEPECLIIEIDLTRLPRQASELSLISRRSILAGDIEAATRRLIAKKKAIRNLKLNKANIGAGFQAVLLEIAGEEVKKRVSDIAGQLANDAIRLFEERSEAEGAITAREIPLIKREALTSRAQPLGKVVLFPSKIQGVDFLKKYNAWGFVATRAGQKQVPYFALYVGRPKSSVLYFGEIESITQPIKSKEDLAKFHEKDIGEFPTGKRVIHLKSDTLVEFQDPIPVEDKKRAPRSLRYTTLDKLIKARHTGDL